MSLPAAQPTGSDAALGEEQVRRRNTHHSFIAWFEAHPALSVACPDLAFLAELTVHPVHCLASRISVQRWELMLRCRSLSRSHAQQWHVYDIDVGLKQRSTLLVRAAFSEVLVQKLMCCRGVCSVGSLLRHAKCVMSRRHFLVSKGLAECLFEEGQRLYKQERYGDAAKSWGQAALLQHGASHAFLSNMVFASRPDVPINQKRAFELAAAGAAMGCAHSKGALGRCLVYGSGVAKDVERGLALGRESAAAGSCFGQFVVGKCYDEGWGVAQDYAEAVRLYRLAAAQGHAVAQVNLGVIFDEGTGVAQDNMQALHLYRLAAAQGNAYAQYNLGTMFRDGQGVAQDYAEAVRLFRLAAAQGDAHAQYSLSRMCEKGLGIAADIAEAIRLYRLAAAQGLADSQCKLAYMYEKGIGVAADTAEAISLYCLAAAQGNAYATAALARLGA
jgi:TPR repeat protein